MFESSLKKRLNLVEILKYLDNLCLLFQSENNNIAGVKVHLIEMKISKKFWDENRLESLQQSG